MNRRVRVAMLDSGVFANNAHIRHPPHGGVTIVSEGERPGFQDTLGHGTAVCALLQQMAPEADLFAVKIFDQRLATSLSIVLRAIEWCVQEQMDVINLSLGTSNEAHRESFLAAIADVQSHHAVLVSAYDLNGTLMLPGSLPGVVGVVEDAGCPRESYRVIRDGPVRLAACPYPLNIDGVPRERNLRGVSFSVAHISAQIARSWTRIPNPSDPLDYLARGAPMLLSDA